MREMLLNASKSYYVGLINKHIANVEILLTRSVGIGEHQDITGEEYEQAYRKMPESIDWSKLADYEKEDTTSGGRELACTADACEMVDIEAS